MSEAATRAVLQKKVFLEISLNSQEKPVSETLFSWSCRPKAQVFSCEFCKISNIFFTEYLRTTASLMLEKLILHFLHGEEVTSF